jgi:hypothetical protein
MMDRLFGVLVSTIVAKPNIVTQLCEDEGDRTFRVCETNPNLWIHEKTMVEVDDRLARWGAGDGTRFAFGAGDAMDTKEITILGENNVFLNVVITEYGAEVLEIVGFADTVGKASSLWFSGIGADKIEEEGSRFVVKPIDDEFWEECYDDMKGAFKYDEDKAEKEGDILVWAEAREKG